MVPAARRRTSGRSYGSYHTGQRGRVHRGQRRYGRVGLTCLFGLLVTGGLIGGLDAATPPGGDITAAAARFLLFYGGVFALIALTATVGIGLVAADRIVMAPRHRVIAQAIHRALSLAALAFLFIHILLEIAAGRSRAADAVVPFLVRGRTFYIGLGTVAADLILLIAASGFLRPRFAASRQPWLWRATHASAYLAWLLSILHGLLAGRTAKPYVDWSYGACLAVVALALAIRLVAASRGRQQSALSAGEAAERPSWPGMPAALTQPGPPQSPIGRSPVARASLPPGHGAQADEVTDPGTPVPPPAGKGGDLARRLPRITQTDGGPR